MYEKGIGAAAHVWKILTTILWHRLTLDLIYKIMCIQRKFFLMVHSLLLSLLLLEVEKCFHLEISSQRWRTSHFSHAYSRRCLAKCWNPTCSDAKARKRWRVSLFRNSCSLKPLLNFQLASPPTTLNLNPENIHYSGTVHRSFCSMGPNISATWSKSGCLYSACKYQWKFASWVLTLFTPPNTRHLCLCAKNSVG